MIPIYPTRRAVILAVAGAPVALVVAVVASPLWVAALIWIFMTAGLILVDVALAPARSRCSVAWTPPPRLSTGRTGAGELVLRFNSRRVWQAEVSIGAKGALTAAPARQTIRLENGAATVRIALTATRRGEAEIEAIWIRWPGPLGLAWVQTSLRPIASIPVVFDIERVREDALRLFARDTPFGVKETSERGDGSDFHALREFQQGMDVRSIDWKQSARHSKLITREHRTERNLNIVLAIDSGRLMSATSGRLGRLDQSINSAMLLAFVGLKSGDRVSVFSFDSAPRVTTGFVSNANAFPALQRLAAKIAYSAEETNFTLGLNTLAGMLERRAMIVLFTDFLDPTSAELMIGTLRRLLRTHMVLFVAFRDESLEAIVAAPPLEDDAAARAVVAHALLQQRQTVISRLRRLGAMIVEPRAQDLSGALLNAYFDAKRRELV